MEERICSAEEGTKKCAEEGEGKERRGWEMGRRRREKAEARMPAVATAKGNPSTPAPSTKFTAVVKVANEPTRGDTCVRAFVSSTIVDPRVDGTTNGVHF